MKKSKILLVLILVFVFSSFSHTSYKKGKGITFFKGSWNEALIKAKKENKFIFLDVYASWCPPCKKLKRTSFKDPEVGNYYNKNFINVTIDGESGEGIELARKYGVKTYPTLFIVDYNGQKRAKSTGFKKPYVLINFGKRIVP